MRRCAACGVQVPKHTLLRVVREADGAVSLDLRGKRSGRGAYLCHIQKCWEQATVRGRLDAVLKHSLTPEQRGGLLQALRGVTELVVDSAEVAR